MKVLLDAPLSDSLVKFSTHSLEFEATPDDFGLASDDELVQFAAEHNYDAVALLGHDNLASLPLMRASHKTGVALVISRTEDPIEAALHLSDHVKDLERHIGPGRVLLVLASELRVVPSG